jgi:hypothetical protein
MPTATTSKRARPWYRSRWFIPLFALALGFVFLGVEWSSGHRTRGLYELAILAAVAAIFAFGGRSETIRGLRGDGTDERFRTIDRNATLLAGFVLIVWVCVAFFVEIANNRSGSPYALMAAVAGLVYIVAVVWQRLRG